jgi:chemotaxis protein CheD
MITVAVGVGDCKRSKDPEVVLVTFALGSCIAVTAYDPVVKAAGLLHYMLPESALNQGKALKNPFLFADTGIPLLFRALYQLGADRHRLVVHAVGGAQVLDDAAMFEIGKRNQSALHRVIGQHGLSLAAEVMGGDVSRTVRFEVGSGRLWIRGPGAEEFEAWSSEKVMVRRQEKPRNLTRGF